jgi:hypothetical protein
MRKTCNRLHLRSRWRHPEADKRPGQVMRLPRRLHAHGLVARSRIHGAGWCRWPDVAL